MMVNAFDKLKRRKENQLKFKFLNFFGFCFLFLDNGFLNLPVRAKYDSHTQNSPNAAGCLH